MVDDRGRDTSCLVPPVVRQNSSRLENQQFAHFPQPGHLLLLWPMFHVIGFCLGSLSRCFHSRQSLLLENLALRQQLAVLKRRHPRPRLSLLDRLFWVLARRLWSAWKQALLVVTPETVVRWHRAGFRLYWSLISRVSRQVASGKKDRVQGGQESDLSDGRREPDLGAPRIQGELLMLGFAVSERTISRWIKRASKDPEPARRWLSFLRNHREAIAAMDFFSVPTVTFGVLYGFFIIAHDRRRILHYNVTRHPTSAWIVQQLREAFPTNRRPSFSFWITTPSTAPKCPPRFAL